MWIAKKFSIISWTCLIYQWANIDGLEFHYKNGVTPNHGQLRLPCTNRSGCHEVVTPFSWWQNYWFKHFIWKAVRGIIWYCYFFFTEGAMITLNTFLSLFFAHSQWSLSDTELSVCHLSVIVCLPSIFFPKWIVSLTFHLIFRIFGLHAHNNIAHKPVEFEFWMFASIFYGILIKKKSIKMVFFF